MSTEHFCEDLELLGTIDDGFVIDLSDDAHLSPHELRARAVVNKKKYEDDVVAESLKKISDELDDREAGTNRKIYQHRGWISQFRTSVVDDEYAAAQPDTELEAIITDHHTRADQQEADTAAFLKLHVEANQRTSNEFIADLHSQTAYVTGQPKWRGDATNAKAANPTPDDLLHKKVKWQDDIVADETDVLEQLLSQEIMLVNGVQEEILTPQAARLIDTRLNQKDITRKIAAADIMNLLFGTGTYHDNPLHRRSSTRRWAQFKKSNAPRTIDRMERIDPGRALQLASVLGIEPTNPTTKE